MRDPNSLPMRLRIWLAHRLDPYPDQGEAWCVGCALNRGRTLVLNVGHYRDHIQRHSDDGSSVKIRTSERTEAGQPE